jgi:hypothetical protein
VWSQRNGRLSTITKVKVLSPEMFIALGQGFIKSETSIAACVNGKCVSNVPGSKSMVGNRIVCTGTWDSHIAPDRGSSNELKRRRRKYGDMAVGLTHSRKYGTTGAMIVQVVINRKSLCDKVVCYHQQSRIITLR